jgi:hypothetical protein
VYVQNETRDAIYFPHTPTDAVAFAISRFAGPLSRVPRLSALATGRNRVVKVVCFIKLTQFDLDPAVVFGLLTRA